MNLRDAKSEVLAIVSAGNAPLLSSPSGIGKTSMCRQVFKYLRDRDAKKGITWGFGTIFAATQTPPDLIGYQFKGEKVFDINGKQVAVTVTDPSVPLWMISEEGKPAFMYDRFFLVIDEYGQGEPDTKRSLAEIFLNGGTSPWYLPEGSVRIACTNQGARYGVSKDFDFCIARRTFIDIVGDAKVWVEDFADKQYHFQGQDWITSPVLKAWALANPTVLFESEPEKQGPWCNPRTLCSADRYLQVKAQFNGGKFPQDALTMESMAGTIGMPATQSVMQHLTYKLELPAYEDVVADPQNTPVPTRADLLMLMAYELAGMTQAKDLTPCLQYVKRMPKDMNITYVSSLLGRDYKSFIDEPAMKGWMGQNQSRIALVAVASA